MAFQLIKCKGPSGLPLIEIPDEGLIAERLSPGEIREADFYDLFRRVTRKGARLLVACPKGKVRNGRCTAPLRVLRIWHDRRNLKPLLKACRDGSLYERRRRSIERILMDIKERLGSSFGEAYKASVGSFIGHSIVVILITMILAGAISRASA